jgi:hypothetical protein
MVNFLKFLTPEQREKIARNREYVESKKLEYQRKSKYELVVAVLHTFHNSGCTSRVAKWQPYDPVYDAALVFLELPELIERIVLNDLHSDDGLDTEWRELCQDFLKHRSGQIRELKCPMKHCTGYVVLP